MTDIGLVKKTGLEEADFTRVREIEAACNHADGIRLKLNLGAAHGSATSHVQELCYYQDGQMVAYMPLDGFGDKFEMTAAVLPAYRRQGIFRLLFEAARAEARRREAKELLLVSYRASQAGAAVVQRLDVVYHSSEYRMEAKAADLPPFSGGEIELEEVTPATVPDLSRLLAVSFGDGRMNAHEALLKELTREDRCYFLARRNGIAIGQIGVIAQEKEVYIRAVGIAPEWRRRGYGRQLLATTVNRMLAEGYQHFELDVATNNDQALLLYQFCGFRETTVYDYYAVPL